MLAADGDPQGRALQALVRSHSGPSALERVQVYADAFFARIRDCLSGDFPALARALGDDSFHDLVKTYLMVHPPTRPSLRHAGARLASHLQTEPFAEIFGRRCPYAHDLARLEWALAEAHGAADAIPISREQLAAFSPDTWPELRLALVPSVTLLHCAFPVHRLRRRADAEPEGTRWSEPPPLAAESIRLCVFRSRDRVRFREISAEEHQSLRVLGAGDSFAQVCEALATSDPARVAATVARWLSDELLALPAQSL